MIEVALICAIVFILALGAIVIFGPQLKRMFEDGSSPILAAAGMGNFNDPNGAVGGNANRTDVNKSLLTTNFIAKGSSNSSIGNAATTETSGSNGTGTSLGSTTMLAGGMPIAADDTTSGSAMLDAANDAKDSATDLLTTSTGSQSDADKLKKMAEDVLDNVIQQHDYLIQLQETAQALAGNIVNVNNHIALVNDLKYTANTLTGSFSQALQYINAVNNNIVYTTASNIATGNNLIHLNREQEKAYDYYIDLKEDYENSWETVCYPESGCKEYNTSGITKNQINSAKAHAQMLLDQVNGQVSDLNNSVSSMKNQAQVYQTQSDKANMNANDLKKNAIKTLELAFWDMSIFNGLTNANDLMNKAIWALGEGNIACVSIPAAYEAIDLLQAAVAAQKATMELDAQVKRIKNNIDQLSSIVSGYDSQSSFNFQANKVDTTAAQNLQTAYKQVADSTDPQNSKLTNHLSYLDNAVDDANKAILEQISLMEDMTKDADWAADQADVAEMIAESISQNAKNAYYEADQTINALLNKASNDRSSAERAAEVKAAEASADAILAADKAEAAVKASQEDLDNAQKAADKTADLAADAKKAAEEAKKQLEEIAIAAAKAQDLVASAKKAAAAQQAALDAAKSASSSAGSATAVAGDAQAAADAAAKKAADAKATADKAATDAKTAKTELDTILSGDATAATAFDDLYTAHTNYQNLIDAKASTAAISAAFDTYNQAQATFDTVASSNPTLDSAASSFFNAEAAADKALQDSITAANNASKAKAEAEAAAKEAAAAEAAAKEAADLAAKAAAAAAAADSAASTTVI